MTTSPRDTRAHVVMFAAEPINWNLLGIFAKRPHPTINTEYVRRAVQVGKTHGVPYLGEIAQENQVSHHLLDMLGVPCPQPSVGGSGHPSDLDARVWRAVAGALDLQERLGRIAGWHSRIEHPHGVVEDVCCECGHGWPCDTRKLADGTWTEDDEL